MTIAVDMGRKATKTTNQQTIGPVELQFHVKTTYDKFPYGKKLLCHELFSRTASKYSGIVFGKHNLKWLTSQCSWNVRKMFTFHMQIRSGANTLS